MSERTPYAPMGLWLKRAEISGKRKTGRFRKRVRTSDTSLSKCFEKWLIGCMNSCPGNGFNMGNGSERLLGELGGLTSRARLLSRFLGHVLKRVPSRSAQSASEFQLSEYFSDNFTRKRFSFARFLILISCLGG